MKTLLQLTIFLFAFGGFFNNLRCQQNLLEPSEDCVVSTKLGLRVKMCIKDSSTANVELFNNSDHSVFLDTGELILSHGLSVAGLRFIEYSTFSYGADDGGVNVKLPIDELRSRTGCGFQLTNLDSLEQMETLMFRAIFVSDKDFTYVQRSSSGKWIINSHDFLRLHQQIVVEKVLE